MKPESRSPVKIFNEEHAQVIDLISELQARVRELSGETAISGRCSQASAEAFQEAIEALAARLHRHFSREELLYGTLQAPLGPGPGMVHSLEDEHDRARGGLARLQSLCRQLQTGVKQQASWPGAPGVDGVVEEAGRAVTEFSNLIADHVRREDTIIFPMVEDVISSRVLTELTEELEEVGPTESSRETVVDLRGGGDRLARVHQPYQELEPGDTLVLRDEQSLQPLYYQMMLRWEGEFIWGCHEESPGSWVATVRRVARKTA